MRCWYPITALKNHFKFCYDDMNNESLDRFVNWCWDRDLTVREYRSITDSDLKNQNEIKFIPRL